MLSNVYYYKFVIGHLGIEEQNGQITKIFFTDAKNKHQGEETGVHKKAACQLNEYFDKKRTKFDLPLLFNGTKFQNKVWQALAKIPYGETTSYKEIAKKVGNEKACRAVGMANNKNPLAIALPCHRVVGAGGKLTGYAGGLETKAFLLNLEK